MRRPHRVRLVLFALIATIGLGRSTGAQALSTRGAQLAVDGTPRFLTFISYFGAMGAIDVPADLAFLKRAGFDGVRIWPNSPEGPQLMLADGTLAAAGLGRLRAVLDEAHRQRLVVDITFTAEHIRGLTTDAYRTALSRVAGVLREDDHVLFDLQNERNLYGPMNRPVEAEDVRSLAAAVKSADPSRIVTASTSGDESAERAASFTLAAALDVVAYHDPRVAGWHEERQARSIVEAVRPAGRPLYLQEPTRYPLASTDRAEYFRQARAAAERAGAAAWCFHTDLGFNLRGARFEDRLRARPEPEWAFVTSLAGESPATAVVPSPAAPGSATVRR